MTLKRWRGEVELRELKFDVLADGLFSLTS